MKVSVTKIESLDRNLIPVTLIARVRAVRRAPQSLVSQEGLIEDDSGEVPFTVWKDSGVKPLRSGRWYLFYRAGLGVRHGLLEVRVTQGSEVFSLKTPARAARVLDKLSCRAASERARAARAASGSRFFRSRRSFYSSLITLALLFWLILVGLHFSGVLGERRVRGWLEKIGVLTSPQASLERVSGKVTEVVDARTIRVQVGGEEWLVHYKGILVPLPETDDRGRLPAAALRSLNYNRYLVRDKFVSLEFDPPASREVWAYVFLDDLMVNAALLSKGCAWLAGNTEDLAYGPELLTAEEAARLQKLGVWQDRE